MSRLQLASASDSTLVGIHALRIASVTVCIWHSLATCNGRPCAGQRLHGQGAAREARGCAMLEQERRGVTSSRSQIRSTAFLVAKRPDSLAIVRVWVGADGMPKMLARMP